ncbi:MAG: hypothetical protein VB139_00170 [Coriobacteriia bacterium]|nr:hypothetical protein [Propionicimonas sp.]MEA5074745.1 hypothetical protein [Coriobacteriia bacterium]
MTEFTAGEVRFLWISALAVLAAGLVWLRWRRLVNTARNAPRSVRRDQLELAVTQTVRLLTGIAVGMFGVMILLDLTDPEVMLDRVPCLLIFEIIAVLLGHFVVRYYFNWMRDDHLSRWALEDRQRANGAADADSCPRPG